MGGREGSILSIQLAAFKKGITHNSLLLSQRMLGYIYYASCTKNVIGSANRRKTTKINVQFSLPKIWRMREKKIVKWSYLSFLPISSSRKRNARGLWKNNFKAFSRSKKPFHQEVCFHYLFPLALSLISLWTPFGLPKTFIYKNYLVN